MVRSSVSFLEVALAHSMAHGASTPVQQNNFFHVRERRTPWLRTRANRYYCKSVGERERKGQLRSDRRGLKKIASDSPQEVHHMGVATSALL
jgi:hypothetical protein